MQAGRRLLEAGKPCGYPFNGTTVTGCSGGRGRARSRYPFNHMRNACQWMATMTFSVSRGNVANSVIQTGPVVLVHILRNSLLGIFVCRRAARTNALALK